MANSNLTSANKIKDWDWDDLCLNPYRNSLEQGRQEGREAGLTSGFQEGRSVGVIKGVEYGMEIGFMRGVVQVVMDEFNSEKLGNIEVTHRERIQKTASALSDLLDTFPQPDQLFGEHNQTWLPPTRQGNNEPGQNAEDDTEKEASEWSSCSTSDLHGLMQSIRSKFKLLTVQLRWSNFSLKKLMDDAAMEPLNSETNATSNTENKTGSKASTIHDPSDW